MKELCVLLLILFVGLPCQGQVIEKIEPPFWWTDMNNPELQIMLYGKDLKKGTVISRSGDVNVKGVHSADSPNYLFVDLEMAKDARSGDHELVWTNEDGQSIIIDYTLHERREGSAARQGFDNSDVLYLITPDRFANGNTDNDEVDGLKEGLDRSKPYGRHGGDLEGISEHLDYIKDMGFTAIWLNPVLINDQPEWSYHGYATTDYYQVDPRFGTNEEYVALSKKGNEMGIGMIMDIIVNHCGSQHWWMKDPPFKDWINYQSGDYQETNHRKETLLDPYGSPADRAVMTQGWFVKAMPDLNQRNPFMSTYLIQNSIWWIEYADLAGIRQDTYSYPFRDFMTDWTCAIQNEYPDFNIVGEEWVDDPAMISYWQQGKNNVDGYTSCLPSLMDFPMTFALHKALTEEEKWSEGIIRLYQHLSKDYHYPEPDNLVVFPDNHDMSRIYTQINEDIDLFKMAITYILTTRGVPQIYYGTEIIMSNKGTDSHGVIRSDFPGGWEGDSVNAFDGTGLDSLARNTQKWMKSFLNWRKNKSVIHTGKLMHYIPVKGVYVYFRYNEKDAVMVILNKNDHKQTLNLERFKERLKNYKSGRLVYDGNNIKTIPLNESLEVEAKSATIIEF